MVPLGIAYVIHEVGTLFILGVLVQCPDWIIYGEKTQ